VEGGLTARERSDAQTALDGLQKSNVSFQLVAISRWVQSIPTACRVRPEPQSPGTYRIYVFWVPALAANPYVWLDMNLPDDAQKGTFRLGATQPAAPIGSTALSQSGPEQARKSRKLMVSHGGGVFAKPGAACQVLKNGSLELLDMG